ncbi:T9SS type A sorting domain-containing protein [Lacihabitans lacunae]|jgi:hypothetical protein|uniref:T9SS type A sorting domain-containing protein n=1 Tax=Lacihabitans lacunae TaxID=1028214 RepID=A0ABV7Z0R6_9BACT
MKKNILLLLLSALIIPFTSYAQCVATADNGDYTVTLNIYPQAIIPSSSSCLYGFNYNISVGYDIQITGTNPPSPASTALYTSQGTITCNNGTNGNQSIFIDLNNGVSSTTTTSTSNPYSSLSDCNTATPASYNCSSFSYEVQGPGLSKVVNCSATSFAMPVQIVSFNGKNKNGYNDLKWKIANPIDFDYFQVQRSFDSKSFETVSEKIPLRNTEDYYWSEKSNLSNNFNYYRLLMKDKDGSIRFSKIISIQNFSNETDLVLYPNPVVSELNIAWNSKIFEPTKMKVLDLKGNEILNTKPATKIDLKNLPSGTYQITLMDDIGIKMSEKIVKMN